MNDLNSIILDGNLVRDPEQRYSSTGTSVCNFCIANNKSKKVNGAWENEVSYFDVITFGKTADNCGQYLKKGSSIRVVGRIQQDRWQDADGSKKQKVKVVANTVEFRYTKGNNDAR